MKQFISMLLMMLVFSSCIKHDIIRIGYETNKSEYKNCELLIQKEGVIIDSVAEKLGEVQLVKGIMTNKCNERVAIEILKNEACAIDANFVQINSEKRQGMYNECYSCQATFYKLDTSIVSDLVQMDEYYRFENINQRVTSKNKKQIGPRIFGAAIAVGVIVFIFMNVGNSAF